MTYPTTTASPAASMVTRIEQARNDLDRPVSWLAEKSGFAYKTLRTRLYGGPEKFTISELSSLANALDVTVEWIVAGVEARKEVPA